jgi:hypothetical protein
MGSCELFAWEGLLISASQVARIIGVSHRHLAKVYLSLAVLPSLITTHSSLSLPNRPLTLIALSKGLLLTKPKRRHPYIAYEAD